MSSCSGLLSVKQIRLVRSLDMVKLYWTRTTGPLGGAFSITPAVLPFLVQTCLRARAFTCPAYISCALTVLTVIRVMPGLLDGRTRAFKLATNAASLLAGAYANNLGRTIGSNLSNLVADGYRRYSAMPPIRKRYTRIPRFRRRRRSKHGYKKHRARPNLRRGRRRLPNRYLPNIHRKLDTNFARNDVESFRLQLFRGQFATSSADSHNFVQPMPTLQELRDAGWNGDINHYKFYKFSRVQWVIEPRSRAPETNFRIATNQLPYLVCRTTGGSEIPSAMAAEDARQTPGLRYVSIFKRSRTIVNAVPSIDTIDTVSREGSNEAMYTRSRRAPWLETESNNSISGNSQVQGYLQVKVPKMDIPTAAGDQLWYDVRCYLTVTLRGRDDNIVPPLN